MSALLWASRCGYTEIVKSLLYSDAEVETKDKVSSTVVDGMFPCLIDLTFCFVAGISAVVQIFAHYANISRGG